jgi:hypothetical protein
MIADANIKLSPNLTKNTQIQNNMPARIIGKRALRSPTTVLINNMNKNSHLEETKVEQKIQIKGKSELQEVINNTNIQSTSIGSGSGAFKAPA